MAIDGFAVRYRSNRFPRFEQRGPYLTRRQADSQATEIRGRSWDPPIYLRVEPCEIRRLVNQSVILPGRTAPVYAKTISDLQLRTDDGQQYVYGLCYHRGHRYQVRAPAQTAHQRALTFSLNWVTVADLGRCPSPDYPGRPYVLLRLMGLDGDPWDE